MYDVVRSQRIYREGGKQMRMLTGAGGIPASRNKIARAFLQGDAEWLWFVDSDMGFAPGTVDALVAAADPAARPVVGALCFAGSRVKPVDGHPLYAERFLIQPTVYEWVELDDEVGFRPIVDYPRDQVFQVGATGAACLLIHRTALAAVRERCGDAWFDPITHPTGLRGGPRTFSEDMSFCVRLQSVGLPVHVDSRVKTTHEKGFAFLDEDAFLHQQAMSTLEAMREVN